jgi:hypothetical protein
MVTDQQHRRTAVRDPARFADQARVTTPHGAVWRTCTGCDALAPLPPEIDRCDQCREVNP